MKKYAIRRYMYAYRRLFLIFITLTTSFTLFTSIKTKNRFIVDEDGLNEERYTLGLKSEQLSTKNNKKSIKDVIRVVNNDAFIHNKHFLLNINDKINSNLTVLLVQVNKRVKYLSALIDSLSNVDGISKTLLIFSHDFYDQQLNDVIKEIKFCSYMQIFYPYSIQIYENKFPGFDPNDCVPMNISKEEALKKGCNNAKYPDKYGNYRSYNIVQIKHHWWWKISYVFDSLVHTKNLENLGVLLLEEDYYLLPDALYILNKFLNVKKNETNIVNIALVAGKFEIMDYSFNIDAYSENNFFTGNHNTGMYVSRSVWRQIKNCSKAFCTYDDYNWDWTLQHVIQTCIKEPINSIFPFVSRIVHIGECGTHHKKSNCDPHDKVQVLKERITKYKSSFFPKKLNYQLRKIFRSSLKPFGGWSDLRDHILCSTYVDYHKNFENVSFWLDNLNASYAFAENF